MIVPSDRLFAVFAGNLLIFEHKAYRIRDNKRKGRSDRKPFCGPLFVESTSIILMAGMTTNTSDSLISDSSTSSGSQSQSAESELVRPDSANVHGDGSDGLQTSPPDEKPAWFQKQQIKRAGGKARPRPSKRTSPAATVIIEQLAPENLSWLQKAVRWLAGCVAMGYGASFLFHIVMLVLFSLFILPHTLDNRFQINVSEGEEGAEDKLVEVVDTRLDFPSRKLESLSPITIMPIPLPTDESARVIDTIRQKIAADLGDFDGEDSGGAFPFGGKKGKNAVTKGNFTAWTVPDDPKPGQPYFIFIEVNLPRKIRRYDSKDLTGHVIGTDGYTTPIGYYAGGRVTPEGRLHERRFYGRFNRRKKQLVIPIPPARDALVEDTIKVRSKILKEEQSLKIVF
jgi:hypothetical protein